MHLAHLSGWYSIIIGSRFLVSGYYIICLENSGATLPRTMWLYLCWKSASLRRPFQSQTTPNLSTLMRWLRFNPPHIPTSDQNSRLEGSKGNNFAKFTWLGTYTRCFDLLKEECLFASELEHLQMMNHDGQVEQMTLLCHAISWTCVSPWRTASPSAVSPAILAR